MAKRKPTPTRRRPDAAPPMLSISIAFTPQELQFLIQALRDLPISGTPDTLAQVLPVVQTIRMKIATAGQAIARAAAGEREPAPIAEGPPPEEKPTE